MSSRNLKKVYDFDNPLKEAKVSSDDEIYTPKNKSLNVFNFLEEESDKSSGDEVVDSSKEIPAKCVPNSKKKKKLKSKKKTRKTELFLDFEDLPSLASTAPVNLVSDSINKTTTTVRRKGLNVEHELKQIFGNNFTPETNRSIRKNYLLVTPKKSWPPVKKFGLTMIQDKAVNNISYFSINHSKYNYQPYQIMFDRLNKSPDPNVVKQVLDRHPFHVDTLIYLSESCRINGDIQIAADLIERALHCLESGFHPSFNVSSINCQLDYRKAENRALFIALFKHVKYVSLKSCWKTAFEVTKLIYNLSPEMDPLACLLLLDTLALKCEDYNFVIAFISEHNHDKNLTSLPNICYSLALAHFYKEIVRNDQPELSTELLVKAVLRFPLLAKLLYNKVTETAEDCFVIPKSVSDSHTRSLTQQCRLYTERSIDLWREPEVKRWFVEVVNSIKENHTEMQEFSSFRRSTFLSPPSNVIRHILIEDISIVSSLLPISVFDRDQLSFDPFPPLNSFSDYDAASSVHQSANVFMEFIRSFFPSYQQGSEVGNLALAIPIRDIPSHVFSFFAHLVQGIPSFFSQVYRCVRNAVRI